MMNEQQQQAHPAEVAQEFMRRADMKGGEVEAFSETFNWLSTFLDGSNVVLTKEVHTALLEELTELREDRQDKETASIDQDVPVLS